jgi:tetratricopeptide (TPR) repeat protein
MASLLELGTLAAALAVSLDSPPPRSARSLTELRSLAYEANFRNDAGQLRRLSDELGRKGGDGDPRGWVLYYAAWTDWALFNAEFQAGRRAEALAAADSAVARARRAAELLPDEADPRAMLANALISLAFAKPDGFRTHRTELGEARRRALELGPRNPRVVLMDAGVVFNSPPEVGGSQEKGLLRWAEAIELFEAEAASPVRDPLRPRWGRALAYGWLPDLYLAMKPARLAEARIAAATALSLCPDFWYVRERVLPRLKS